MVDYEFYVNQYLGSAIPETAFPGMAAQANGYLDRFRRIYRVESSGETAEAMAVCAMAEALWVNRKQGISTASVGNISVRYDTQKKTLARDLYEKASVYLDIYRGVS